MGITRVGPVTAGYRVGAQHTVTLPPTHTPFKGLPQGHLLYTPGRNYSSLPWAATALSVVELFGASLFLPCLMISGYKPCYLDGILGFLGSGTVSSSSCLWKNCTKLQRDPDYCSESSCFREVRGFVTL